MTIEQAINVVDAAASLAPLNRSQHSEVIRAINLIKDEIQKQNGTEVPQEQ